MGPLDEHGREGMLTLWETVRGQIILLLQSVLRKAWKMHISALTQCILFFMKSAMLLGHTGTF